MSVKTFTLDQIKRMRDRTDVGRLRRMRDEDIDLSDVPELSVELIRRAVAKKQQISLRLDEDVVAWFRRHGRGYQSRMNAVLRAFMQVRQAKKGKRSARRAA
jgi:uncharacterized protein (DUF4415 family)